MDTRQLVRGTTLYLPVEVEGALFSCGDAQAAQGEGEVCVTGIEAPMHGELRFTLQKGRRTPGAAVRPPPADAASGCRRPTEISAFKDNIAIGALQAGGHGDCEFQHAERLPSRTCSASSQRLVPRRDDPAGE